MSATAQDLQSLQQYLIRKFQEWQPRSPDVVERTKRSVTLKWLEAERFGFLQDHLLYKVQRKEKIPPWVTVYSGGKTTKVIENLAPSHPHKFRLQVTLKPTSVHVLAEEALKHYGDEHTIYEVFESTDEEKIEQTDVSNSSTDEVKANAVQKDNSRTFEETKETSKESEELLEQYIEASNSAAEGINNTEKCINTKLFGAAERRSTSLSPGRAVSRWSPETWTSTDTDGTSAACFCMAVRCGYYKQVQIMLEERPALIDAINCSNGLTPLATAVRKGDLNTVKYVLSLGAAVDQRTVAGQTPLHLAVLHGHTAVADCLLDKGAHFQAQDLNGLRVEHYAVDSCKLEVVRYVLERGGDVEALDSNGWTPLFRAVCQGAKTEIIEELLHRGSSVDIIDRRGLALVSAARLLKNRLGRARDSVLRAVDARFPHEKARANFSRLTRKICSVHTLLK